MDTRCLPTRVAVAQGVTENQSINRMVKDMATALIDQGVHVEYFNVNDWAEWACLPSKGCGAVIFYGLGFNHALRMRSFLSGRDVIFICLDHPMYFIDGFQGFKTAHRGLAIGTLPTATNLSFAARRLGAANEIHPLRHSANSLHSVVPMDQRPQRILFVGNFSPEEAVRTEIQTVASHQVAIFDAAASRLIAKETGTLEDAVAPFFVDAFGGDWLDFLRMCIWVDRHMRSHVRREAFQSLSGLPVDVVGRGWDALSPSSSFNMLGTQDSPSVLRLIRKAQIVVNTTPFYYHSHERMFDAAAAGAVLVTARNETTQRLFSCCAQLYDDESEIGSLCSALLQDVSSLETLGQNGVRLIDESEGWPHRVVEILERLRTASPRPLVDAPAKPIMLDFRKQASFNFSFGDLAATKCVVITGTPEHMDGVIQFFVQTSRFLEEGVSISIIITSSLPLGWFGEVSQFLENNGYQTIDVIHSDTQTVLTVRKCKELDEIERVSSFVMENRVFSIAYAFGRDTKRRTSLHWKTFHDMAVLQRMRDVDKLGAMIDLGADIGNYAIFAAAILGRRVVAYETDQTAFQFLGENITRNDLDGAISAKFLEREGEIMDFGEPVAILRIEIEGCEMDFIQAAHTLLKTHTPVVFLRTPNEEACLRATELMSKMRYMLVGQISGSDTFEFTSEG